MKASPHVNTTHPGALYRDQNGELQTSRLEAAELVWGAVGGLASSWEPEGSDERRLFDAVFRLTERRPYRLTEAALKELADVLNLTIKLARLETVADLEDEKSSASSELISDGM